MIRELWSALEKIENHLVRLGREALLSSLQPGLHLTEVKRQLAGSGLRSLELESLYSWRNGSATDKIAVLDDLHIMPGFYLLSLEDALENYRVFVADARWTVGWLPILENGGGDFYAVDTSVKVGPQPVYAFRIEQGHHPIEFNSIADMFGTFAEAFERGVFFVDVDGYLEMDDL